MPVPPNQYEQGQLVRITVTTVDGSGVQNDPTALTLKIQKPDGTLTTVTWPPVGPIARDGPGAFHYDIDTTPGPSGLWQVRSVATGAVTSAGVDEFIVNRPNTQ